ncbi:leucyl-cystinyl aminopeptidase-like, partial [Sinocyclocheilus grahami]|uniref:leucyl-cystinyl aminopeptidase-like n=1 Tax=Sinocyclocheilus grahami TaxID=75366 RepID=UPI0007AC6CFC
MEWWNDIWLNEGFARYMEFVSLEAVYPELKVEDHLLDTCFGAIGRDSLNSSRPISSLAENPTQIKEMFDTVSYEKGACILHMLRNFLTNEGFQNGIIRYLRRFRYSNARNEDLWDSLIKTCSEEDFTAGEYCYSSTQATKNAYRFAGEHIDLKKMMYTWTIQKGIPLITVKRQGRKLYIGQERFLKIVLPGDPSWHSLQKGIASSYTRQQHSGSCLKPSTKTTVVGVLILVLVASMFMVIYFLPGCTFTRKGCQKTNSTMDSIYPISTSGERFPWTELRLPPSVHPVHYNISLHPNLALMTFQGCVSILVQVLHETKNIVLHSSDMNISKVTFEGKEVHVLEYKPWQQIAIKFPEDLKKGQYVLNINYTAKLSNSYDGFYNSSYVDTNGTKRVLAATQFEPLAARKAFPCFDEPAFKSTFTIKMTRERKYISLSNMPK